MLLLMACTGVGPGSLSGGGSAGSPSSSWDTGVCDTRNESCRVNSCRGDGANMLPGSDCLTCHSDGGDREATRFSVGGTVFTDWDGVESAPGTVVRVTDATGKTVEMTASRAGNFYSSERLTPPLSAEVENAYGVFAMDRTVDDGACNTCHVCDDEGKIYAP